MPRPARPDDLYRMLVPSDPRLSPDGRLAVVSVKSSAPAHDGYRQAVWLAQVDGAAPARRLTLGARTDSHARFSPDGRSLAFLSDRRLRVEDEPDRPSDEKEREDRVQVHLLPLDGGEARRLTDLPRGVDSFAWSPDGTTLAVLTSSLGATEAEDRRKRGRPAKPKPGETPLSDFRYIDRLEYMLNGAGFIDDRVQQLWLVDATTGAARPLVVGPTSATSPAWSPDGTRIAFAANRTPEFDLTSRSALFVVDVATGDATTITSIDDSLFDHPAWLPDGSAILALGDRFPRGAYRIALWRFAADGSDAGEGGGTDLLAHSDLQPGAGMNSDVTLGEAAHLVVAANAEDVLFTAPVDGSYELWRTPVAGDGTARPRRVTDDQHYLSGWDARAVDGLDVLVAVRSTPTRLPEVVALEDGRAPRAVTALNDAVQADAAWSEPQERRWESDGRSIQGWLYPAVRAAVAGEAAPSRRASAADGGAPPLVLEIHGGPHTLYGWSPVWEWQVLAGAGISVLACNPRGSEGYGEDFNRANLGDWGDGPMADVLAGVDGVIADGLADPHRLGVTGGSYGGYLTNWIVGRTDRFRAAVTCRSVVDMRTLFLTGDVSGGEWAELEFGRSPWEDPGYFESISPLSLAGNVHTPLLIQHAEQDLRCTVGQAEALFSVLRTFRRPVRMMRVPNESHELTRSGTPFRRVENLVQIRDWFVHFLVRGGRKMPPPPRNRAGA